MGKLGILPGLPTVTGRRKGAAGKKNDFKVDKTGIVHAGIGKVSLS
jgi:ribosomal protein L1